MELRTWITLLGAVGGARPGVLLRAVVASRQCRGRVAAVSGSRTTRFPPPPPIGSTGAWAIKSDAAFCARFLADLRGGKWMPRSGGARAPSAHRRDALVSRGAHPYLMFMADSGSAWPATPGRSNTSDTTEETGT